MLRFKYHKNQNYTTLFNPDNGFFARIEDPDFPEPKFSHNGPELIDISITGWCDRSCPMCYRNSNINGKHMTIADYEKIIKQASAMGVLQVAIGGGNPNQHPDFLEILKLTRTIGIVPSYTSNGRGLSHDVLVASKKYCGAVAISAYNPYEELGIALRKLINAGIKTNIHFVLDATSIKTAISWLSSPPSFLSGINAIVFLNYKPVGRQATQELLLKNTKELGCFFELIEKKEHSFRVGFDSCMVSGLAAFTKIDPQFYDACEAARFSMFISEDMRMYPCSFMEPAKDGVFVHSNNILDTWQNSSLFREFRDKLLADNCNDCNHIKICFGGCPICKSVNLCGEFK